MNNLENLDESERFVYEWQFGMLGGFKRSLIETIGRADGCNLDLLRLGFPDEVLGYENYTRIDGWWQNVKIKAGK